MTSLAAWLLTRCGVALIFIGAFFLVLRPALMAEARQQELAAGAGRRCSPRSTGVAVAVIGIADAVRPTSAAAVAELRSMGVEVVMLTGDNAATARRGPDRPCRHTMPTPTTVT